jgi:N-acetylglucosamine-6-phosphate deacetylase
MLVTACGATPVDAAAMCATTPARQLGRSDLGTLTPGGAADIVVLDSAFDVRYTLVGGALAYSKVS